MTPTLEHESERLYRQFFRPEFATQRLGAPGEWQGSAIARLGLQNPVQESDLANLLKGWTPDGQQMIQDPLAANSVRAWRCSLRADPPLNALWALSSESIREQIRLAHTKAVQVAVADFENTLNGRSGKDRPIPHEWKLTLVAKFESGASREQTPQLETNLLLLNFVIHRGDGGGLTTFPQRRANRIEQRMQSVYKQVLEKETLWAFGSRIQLPEELCQRLQQPFEFGPLPANPTAGKTALQGNELFTAWQEQGRSWGWGPDRVESLHEAAGRQLNWRNLMREFNATIQSGTQWFQQRVLEPKRVVDQPVKGHDLEQPATGRNTEPNQQQQVPAPAAAPQARDKGMTHSY